MITHLKARGHKSIPFTPVTSDCGKELMHMPKSTECISVGRSTDVKDPKATLCPDCVFYGETVPESEFAK